MAQQDKPARADDNGRHDENEACAGVEDICEPRIAGCFAGGNKSKRQKNREKGGRKAERKAGGDGAPDNSFAEQAYQIGRQAGNDDARNRQRDIKKAERDNDNIEKALRFSGLP
ncbi:hypothetical protein BR141012304_10948 [Brucella inopinata]|nr:hypothetical protein BR141012304_10948 [Brucella inopinata]